MEVTQGFEYGVRNLFLSCDGFYHSYHSAGPQLFSLGNLVEGDCHWGED